MATREAKKSAKKKRRKIPLDVTRLVLAEAGYRCGVPTCRTIIALDMHHIHHVADGGGDDPTNLIALCPTCHRLYHRGEINRSALSIWKGTLVALSCAFDRQSIDLLMFLHAMRSVPVSVDGLLRFAYLIGAGLVCERGGDGYGDGRPRPFTHVQLSPRGESLIDAWIAGDREAFERAMSVGRV